METSFTRRGKKFILTNYLERGIEVAVITSRLFVLLGDWPRNPSFLLTPSCAHELPMDRALFTRI